MGIRALYGHAGAALIKIYIKAVYRPVCVDKPGDDGAVVYITNHSSRLDGLMMLAALSKEKPYALVAKDWFDIKILKPVFECSRGIPLNRYGLDTSWLHTATDRLKNGSSIIIFPEGHTVRDGEIKEFKSGFVMLSLLTGAKIVPLYHGRFRPFCKNKLYFAETQGCLRKGMTAEALAAESQRFKEIVEVLEKQHKN
ncbi:MAG: 1-acyl-sn-glycerol-3-phosphate acyltransferase [Clostridia bacterium]|nr:1-acyl-sn-glycerol-3-phosphate acyltransferase [Clostridia bacterium]